MRMSRILDKKFLSGKYQFPEISNLFGSLPLQRYPVVLYVTYYIQRNLISCEITQIKSKICIDDQICYVKNKLKLKCDGITKCLGFNELIN